MRIAIIGAGFSGCQLAIELLRSGPSPLDILLFDQSATFGPGVAFGARHDRLLLNTRVANMSALATDPQPFPALAVGERSARASGGLDPAVRSRLRRARRLRPLSAPTCLDQSEAQAPSGVALHRIGQRVVGLAEEQGGLRADARRRQRRAADLAVLCIGNLPPRLPPRAGRRGPSLARG